MKVNVKGFLLCPVCGKKTHVKVLPKTVLRDFPLWCPWCKQETIVDKN